MLKPTYYGLARTLADVNAIFKACQNGRCSAIRRVLKPMEKRSIGKAVRPGWILVWDANASDMLNWTDGRHWSSAYLSGPFTTYHELKPGSKSPREVLPGGLTRQILRMQMSDGTWLHLVQYYDEKFRGSNPSAPSDDPYLSDTSPSTSLSHTQILSISQAQGSRHYLRSTEHISSGMNSHLFATQQQHPAPAETSATQICRVSQQEAVNNYSHHAISMPALVADNHFIMMTEAVSDSLIDPQIWALTASQTVGNSRTCAAFSSEQNRLLEKSAPGNDQNQTTKSEAFNSSSPVSRGHDWEPYSCPHCAKSFQGGARLRRHMKIHESTQWKCFEHLDLDGLFQKCHQDHAPVYRCGCCGQFFPRIDEKHEGLGLNDTITAEREQRLLHLRDNHKFTRCRFGQHGRSCNVWSNFRKHLKSVHGVQVGFMEGKVLQAVFSVRAQPLSNNHPPSLLAEADTGMIE